MLGETPAPPIRRFWVYITLGSLLAGCTLPAPTLGPAESADREAFAVSGRFAVRYGKEGGNGQLDWHHTASSDELTLRGPLGANIATITRQAGVYTLNAPNREPEQAQDPDQLTEQILGWRLPMRGLPYWLRGQVQPGEPAQAEPKQGAPKVLHQAGWNIEYQSRYPDSGLPERLVLGREDLQIRLILTNWATGN